MPYFGDNTPMAERMCAEWRALVDVIWQFGQAL